MLQRSMTNSGLFYAGIFTATVAVSAALFAGIWVPLAGIVAVVVIVAGFHFLVSAARQNNLQILLVVWAVVCPLGYSLVQIPRSFTIFTLDRMAAACALMALFAAALRGRLHIPVALRTMVLLWTAFVAVTVFSLRAERGAALVGDLRMLVEVFVLPGILALYIILCFNVHRQISHLHIAICIVAIYLALIGMTEVVSGTDLFPTALERNAYFAGSGDLRLFRADGPYGTNSTYATVGVINLLLLEFLRRNMVDAIKGWRRALHYIATACTCVVAILPMFRATVLTLIIVATVALFRKRRAKAIMPVALMIVGVVLFALVVKMVSPDLFDERVRDQENVNARLAEYKQAIAVFSDHPFFGVGLNQFYSSVADRYKYLFFHKGESSLDYPHSMSLALLAETGSVGFIFFVSAQVAMLIGFRKLLMKGRSGVGATSWDFVILLFLTYCGMNVDLVSGYYDELNIWYLFVLAVVVKYGIEQAKQGPARNARAYAQRKPVYAE